MAILVTGGAGYIGSHVVLELLDAGEQVVAVDNLSEGYREAVAPGAAFIPGDIGDRALVESIIRRHAIDEIIHLAGSIVVPDSVADPLGYYRNNTVKSRALIEAAVRTGVGRFVFSSSAAVYGNPNCGRISEDAPTEPTSPYGASKLMTEWMLRDVGHAHDMRYVNLRYFNVAGADPNGRAGQCSRRSTHLIKIACEAMAGERDGVTIFGTDYPTADGTCVRDYVHVSDLACAHSCALACLRAGGPSQTLNCGYSRGYSVQHVIDAAKRVSGIDFRVDHAERRPGDPPELVADARAIAEKLGWTPKLNDLDTIISHALSWERHLSATNAVQTVSGF